MAKSKNKKTTNLQFKGIDMLYSNFPFICFLAVLGVLYIANAHSAEKKARKIQAINAELQEARWQYESIRHDLIYRSTQSQLVERIKEQELEISEIVPKKIN